MLSAWVALAASAQTGSAQPAPPRARIVEDLRLDADKEDFPAIGRIFVGPQRQIAVPIQQDMQIRLYSATGKSVGTIGRRGSGPGEFQWVSSLMWKADTLVVDDKNQMRLTYIAPNAHVLRTITYPAMRSVSIGGRVAASTGGEHNYSLLSALTDGSFGISWNAPATKGSSDRTVFGDLPWFGKLDADGQARALIRTPKWSDERWFMEAFGFGDAIPFTFTPQVIASPSGDRMAHMTAIRTTRDSGVFTVSAFRSNGDTMFVKTFPFRGDPVSRFSRDSALKEFDKMNEGGQRVIDRFKELARTKMPSIHPGVDYFLLGLDNTVWIALRATSAGQPVMVLSAKGSPIATVVVPTGSRLRQASATQLWMTEKNQDGIASVVRYRVTGIIP